MEEWLEIGKIVAPQGLKGELRVNASSDFPQRFEDPGQRWLQLKEITKPQPIELLGGYQIPGKNVYVVQLEGVEDRNQAEGLRGCKLLVKTSDRPELFDDEYHVSDLIDLEVYNQLTAENIGIVIDVFWAGHDLLEVKLHKQPVIESAPKPEPSKITRISKKRKKNSKKPKPVTVFIPFVKEIVPVVDIEANRLEIKPPPGLLEVNQNRNNDQ
ncbi:MAG: ribosome maturation factor RimM [Moorea sp. SIO2B7]|nr:ribosome maturation factor RimM [Moorena sp. SIO2B7]